MDRLVDALIYLIALASVTYGITRGDILEEPRRLAVSLLPRRFEYYGSLLVVCPMCMGFWIGIAGSFVLDPTWLCPDLIVSRILSPWVVSVAALALARLLDVARE